MFAGVMLYGAPGTGKTLLARACAAQTKACFLKLAGPQLVQVRGVCECVFVIKDGGNCACIFPFSDDCILRSGQNQMFIGDGAKIIRDAFALAREKSPAIIFIDELDAIGTKRVDSDLNGDREVQRTMLELLNQMDGFSTEDTIKVRQ